MDALPPPPPSPAGSLLRTQKKPSFPVKAGLREYLQRYKRENPLSVTYERLRGFH